MVITREKKKKMALVQGTQGGIDSPERRLIEYPAILHIGREKMQDSGARYGKASRGFPQCVPSGFRRGIFVASRSMPRRISICTRDTRERGQGK